MKLLLFLFIFNLVSCATKIITSGTSSINSNSTGLLLYFKLPPELIAKTCMAHFTSESNKRFFLPGSELAKDLTILSLPEGSYSFHDFECSNIWGTKTKLIIKTPYLSNLNVVNSKISITVPIIINAFETTFSIQPDLKSEDKFYLSLAGLFSKSDNAISAYNKMNIPIQVLKTPSQQMISIHVPSKYKVKSNELLKELMDCKQEEFNKYFLLIGSAHLRLPNQSKVPSKDRGHNTYSEDLHRCVNTAIYKSKIPQGESLEVIY